MGIRKSTEMEKFVKEKYQTMIEKGTLVEILDEEKFGKLSVFIDKKPKFCLASFEFDTHKVFVGLETLK
jgi:hypothetical protein